MDKRFTDIVNLIKQARYNAIKAVNAELIKTYIGMWANILVKELRVLNGGNLL